MLNGKYCLNHSFRHSIYQSCFPFCIIRIGYLDGNDNSQIVESPLNGVSVLCGNSCMAQRKRFAPQTINYTIIARYRNLVVGFLPPHPSPHHTLLNIISESQASAVVH